MAKVCKEQYKCEVPGEIEDSKIDEYKQNVIVCIKGELALIEQQRLMLLELGKKVTKAFKKVIEKRNNRQLEIAYDYASK